MKKSLNYIFLTCISAFFTGIFFPPIKSSYFMFITLIPFFSCINSVKNKKSAAFYGWLYGFITAAISINWIFKNVGAESPIREISGFGLLVVLGIFYGIISFVYKIIKDKWGNNAIWTLPLLFVFIDHLMLYEELAFPWITIANTMTYKLEFIQSAEIFGSFGITFIVVLFNVIIYKIIEELFINGNKKRVIIYIFSIIIIFLCNYFYGKSRLNSLNKEVFKEEKVAIIHANLDPLYKWEGGNFNKIFEKQMFLSDSISKFNPKLIIWGETNFPEYLESSKNYEYYQKFSNFAKDKGINMLIGALGFEYIDEKLHHYNSAFSFENDGNVLRYDKIKLVPFGEGIPYSKYFDFLKNISLGQGSFSRGSELVLFNLTNNIKYSVSICYEDIFPYLNADFAKKGADFFANISNDSWYENTNQIYQHSRFNIYRAIENRRSIIRLANRAESSYISPTGELKLLFDSNSSVGKEVSIKINDKKTFFTLYGKIISYIFIILVLVILFMPKFLINKIFASKLLENKQNKKNNGCNI